MPVRRAAAALGRLIGRYPLLFVGLPLGLVALLFGPFLRGLQQFWANTQRSSIELFLPDDMRSQEIVNRLHVAFADGGYFGDRTFTAPNLFVAIVWSPAGLSVLQRHFARHYVQLRQRLESVPVAHNGTRVTYAQVCALHDGPHCKPDGYLRLMEAMENVTGQEAVPTIEFPDVRLPDGRTADVGALFGGVTLDGRHTIGHAKYVRMIFDLPLDLGTGFPSAFGHAWSNALAALKSDDLEAVWWNPTAYLADVAETGDRTKHWLPLLAVLLVSFSAGSMMMRDPVASKPWLAVGGVLSAACGIVVAQGLLHMAGVHLIQIAMVVPFLVLSIGVDDMFVLVNVWRRTDGHDRVPCRLAATYRDAAAAISITTVTDAGVFVVGIFSNFKAIRIFCIHCALAICVVFLYQILMFGALMALSGYRERDNRHAITLCKVRSKESSSPVGSGGGLLDLSLAPSISLTASSGSGGDESRRTSPAPKPTAAARRHGSRPLASVYFGTTHTRLLRTGYMQSAVALSYLLFILLCAAGLTRIEQGLLVRNLVPYDTRSYAYSVIYEREFTEYSTSAELVISGLLDTSNAAIAADMLAVVEAMESTKYTRRGDHCWLRAFHNFLLFHYGSVALESALYYEILLNDFLTREPYRRFKHDMVLRGVEQAAAGARPFVKHSRCYVPLLHMGMRNRSDGMRTMLERVDRLRLAYPQLSVHFYDVSFPLAEQFEQIGPSTAWNVAAAGASMLLVAFVFIPQPAVCLLVALAVLSINLGVLACLALLHVNLDIISKITVLLSIGFSVDFCSHVAYHFCHAKGANTDERLAHTLETIGWPITQSALSTLVGVAALAGIRSYISETFVKTVSLVMVIGLYHGLFVLPTVLRLLGGCGERQHRAEGGRRKAGGNGRPADRVSPPSCVQSWRSQMADEVAERARSRHLERDRLSAVHAVAAAQAQHSAWLVSQMCAGKGTTPVSAYEPQPALPPPAYNGHSAPLRTLAPVHLTSSQF